jgi:hypothetical protein
VGIYVLAVIFLSWEGFMSKKTFYAVSTISILILAASQTVLAPNRADAQAVQPTPTLNTKINQLRLNSRIFHPEHGEVSLEAMGKLDYGADKPGLELNRYLSIFVSDVDTTKAITFSDVMSQLVKQSGDPQLTKDVLFHQWWDTGGQGPGLQLGPHCDDDGPPTPNTGIANNTATTSFNSFPYRCPRLEQSEALSDPFAKEGEVDAQGKDVNAGAYSAVAFSNRFDLIGPPVPAVGSAGLVEYPDCGEYRIIFARNSGKTDPLNRNLIIFEARVPNPDRKPEKIGHPSGCLPILNFWHSLSDIALTAEQRGAKLRAFYLEGKLGPTAKPLPSPVVDISNYSFGSGQIRTNQFMGNEGASRPFDWTLREFKCLPTNGTLIIVPDTVKTNPGASLFVEGSTDHRVSVLSQDIRAQMRAILGGDNLNDVNKVGFSISGEGINSFESDEKGLAGDPAFGDILAAFKGNGSPRNDPLVSNIQGALNIALPGGNVTPLQVITRISTQTCAGCHQFSDGLDLGGGAKWPNKAKGDLQGPTDRTNHPPMPFTQESEKQADLREAISVSSNGKKGNRYAISTTVECLLDAREMFMKQAIGLPPARGPVVDHCK